MKDYALELASRQIGINAKLNTIREYLQAYTLKLMHDEGMFRTTVFVGGTALRFLYDLPRYSEDLDFSVSGNKADEYPFERLLKKIKENFTMAGYDIQVTYNPRKTVLTSFLRFSSLMYEAGVSPLKSQKLSIKLEIDTNPPAGAILKTGLVNKYFPLSFLSHDVASLFAGKIHALMSRGYTKGRDFFDLGWYLSKWDGLTPNIVFLGNALKQTGWKKDIPSADTWRERVLEVVRKADWKNVQEDVENFLQNPSDMNVFSKDAVIMLITKSV